MLFEPKQLYHVYNRGNNSQIIFFEDRNYNFFVQKMKLLFQPHTDILAYCLIPNHFHILIVTKESLPPNDLNNKIAILLRSYTRAINLQENRTGSLFQQKTKAKKVSDYGLLCMNYIHQNPYNAGLAEKLEDWEYSSFSEYLGKKERICNCTLAYEMFELESKEEFYQISYESISDSSFGKILDK